MVAIVVSTQFDPMIDFESVLAAFREKLLGGSVQTCITQ